MRSYNLLISHSWKHSDSYDRLVSLLKNRGYFNFKNYSVPKTNPIIGANSDKQLRTAIEQKVVRCNAVLILAGVYSSHSKWITIEIDLANKLGKPIIAIQPWGAEKTSVVVKTNARKIVGWNSDSIVKAVRELC